MKITVLGSLDQEGGDLADIAVAQVAGALRQARNRVSVFGVHGDPRKLAGGLTRRQPELVFNLMETFADNGLGAIPVVGSLDLLGIPYTGAGPGELYLQEDKALTRKLLAFEQIRSPDFAVFSNDTETGGTLRFPLLVRPLRMDAATGVGARTLVRTAKDLMDRVVEIHEKVHDSALVEEYIEGREFFVGVLGNNDPVAFPPIEKGFSGLSDIDSRVKWDEKDADSKGMRAVVAEIEPELRARLQKTALDAYRALRVRDYGRVDVRLTETGEIYVIEMNGSCGLEQTGDFAIAAAAHGLDFPALVNRIAELALERHQAPSEAKRSRRRAAPARERRVLVTSRG